MIHIYGASDDLIEIEGDVREEFTCYDESLIALSSGHLIRAKFDVNGWSLRVVGYPVKILPGEDVETGAVRDDEGDLNEWVKIHAPVSWISCGSQVVKVTPAAGPDGRPHLGSATGANE